MKRSFGIGPIITYSTKIRKSHLDFNARWIHDFDVSKRVEGEGFNFTASLKFESLRQITNLTKSKITSNMLAEMLLLSGSFV